MIKEVRHLLVRSRAPLVAGILALISAPVTFAVILFARSRIFVL